MLVSRFSCSNHVHMMMMADIPTIISDQMKEI